MVSAGGVYRNPFSILDPNAVDRGMGSRNGTVGKRAQQGVEDLPAQAQIRSHGHPVAPAQRLHCCAVAGMSLDAIGRLPRLLKPLPVPHCLGTILFWHQSLCCIFE